MALRLETKDGPLRPVTYPKDGLKRQADGTWPRSVDYQDSLALDQLQQAGFRLKPGAELEYWLEAADHCDYPPPGPNVGRSEKYTIKLAEPAPEPKEEPPPPNQEPNNRAQNQPPQDKNKQANP